MANIFELHRRATLDPDDVLSRLLYEAAEARSGLDRIGDPFAFARSLMDICDATSRIDMSHRNALLERVSFGAAPTSYRSAELRVNVKRYGGFTMDIWRGQNANEVRQDLAARIARLLERRP